MIRIQVLRVAVLFTIMLTLSCATNPYSKFYFDKLGGRSVQDFPSVEAHIGEPLVFTGNDPATDFFAMLENGFGLVGYSSFNASKAKVDDAIEQAKRLKAGAIVIYSRYTNTLTGTRPLFLPNPSQTSTTYHSRTISGESYSGMSTTTTPAGYSIYPIPYSVNRYDFFASYWVKYKTLTLGVHLGHLPSDLRQKLQRNRGVIVAAVVNGSPAFDADLLRGDVITKIGEDEVSDTQSAMRVIDKYSGKEVPIEFIRNGENRKVSLKLRERAY